MIPAVWSNRAKSSDEAQGLQERLDGNDEFNAEMEITMNTVNPSAYKQAMRQFPAAVNLITTKTGACRTGFTASAVMSLTAEPPQIVVAMNKSVSGFGAFIESGRFCVNTLASHHSNLARDFAGIRKGDERFDSSNWSDTDRGSPALADAVINLDCAIVKTIEFSSHVLLVGLVQEVRTDDTADPLLYVDGEWASTRSIDDPYPI